MAFEKVALDIPAEANDPIIQALDVSGFAKGDLLNMILQRSEVLYDSPRGVRAVRSWMDGDSAPIESEIDRLGDDIARRVAGVLHAEYRAMKETLAELAPTRIADIGCGYAIWDLFAARDLGCDILLIDIEQNENRHFGYAAEAAAYTSLAGAKTFLVANGIDAKRVVTINPDQQDLSKAGAVDLAVSFVSCGFHYPASTYMDFFTNSVSPGGSIMLDLRKGNAAAQIDGLAPLGAMETFPGHKKARRVLLRKPKA